MKKKYDKQFSYYDWLTQYHGLKKAYLNKDKTKCKISNNFIIAYQIKDRILNPQKYDLNLLMNRCLVKFSDKRMSDNNLIKALCYEKDYHDIDLRPADFYARESEAFPWDTWMVITFFYRKTKLYDPKKHFSLAKENNEKMICHMSALSYIDIITVADNSLFGFVKHYNK